MKCSILNCFNKLNVPLTQLLTGIVSWPKYASKTEDSHKVLPQADQTKLTALPYVFIDLQLYLARGGEGGVGRAICESNAP